MASFEITIHCVKPAAKMHRSGGGRAAGGGGGGGGRGISIHSTVEFRREREREDGRRGITTKHGTMANYNRQTGGSKLAVFGSECHVKGVGGVSDAEEEVQRVCGEDPAVCEFVREDI